MKKRYRHLFFDLDETLWDFRRNSEEVLDELFTHYGLDRLGTRRQQFSERYHQYNTHFWAQYRRGEISHAELRSVRWYKTLEDFGLSVSLAQELSEQYLLRLPTRSHLIDGARELLAYLFPRYQLHVLTNGFTEIQYRKLHAAGIYGFFQHVVTSEHAKAPKPKAEIFEYAFRRCGATAQDSLLIGDSLEADIYGAMGVGMDCVWFTVAPQQALPAATHTIAHLLQLKQLL